MRLPQGGHGDAQLLRGERGSLAQQWLGGVPRVRAAVLRRGGLVPLLGHLKAGDVRRTRFFGPRHLCAFIFNSFYFRNTHHWAIQLTSCFVVTVYVSRRAWAKTGGTSAAEQARGVQQRRGERALSWGGDQWGADDTQPVAEPRQEGRRSERRLIPTAGGVRELLGN